MTPDLILRLVAVGAALVLAVIAAVVAIRGRSSGEAGCLAVVLGVAAAVLLCGALLSGIPATP